MVFYLKNLVLTLLGKPKYVPLYADGEQIGWINEDLSKGYIEVVDGFSSYSVELNVNNLNLRMRGDGYEIII